MREDLRKQFSSDSEDNPLAGFQRASLAVVKQTSDQQAERLHRDDRDDHGLRLEVERERGGEGDGRGGRAGGRARDGEGAHVRGGRLRGAGPRSPSRQGDDCDAVGDVKGATGQTGDVVVSIEACTGPARGRVVFEAKTARLSTAQGARGARPRAHRAQRRLRGAGGARRGAHPGEDAELREHGGDKLVVCFDPEDGSTLALEVAYSLARARVLMARGEADGVDSAASARRSSARRWRWATCSGSSTSSPGRRPRSTTAAKILDAMATPSAASSRRSSC